MVRSSIFVAVTACWQVVHAACPYMEDGTRSLPDSHPAVRRDESPSSASTSTDGFLAQFEVDDTDVYLTNNFGGHIEDQESLSAGERGPTLLEDFTFREKIMHFGTYDMPVRSHYLTGIPRSRACPRKSSACARRWCARCFHIFW